MFKNEQQLTNRRQQDINLIPCIFPVCAGPDVLSDSADGGVPAQTQTGGDAEAERERANGPQRSPEGGGGHPRQGGRDTPRAVPHRHGEAP